MAKGKEVEVKELEAPQQEVPQGVQIDGKELEGYVQILRMVLVDDARLVPLEKHFVTMVNNAYENSKKQSE